MSTRNPLVELADLFVLGLLDAAEQAEVEARIETEPDLRRAVGLARDRFLALDLTATPLAPSTDLWARIEPGLEQPAAPAARLPDPRPARRTEPRALAGSPARPVPRSGVARGWRSATLAATAAAILLAVGLGWSVSRPGPQVIAVLLDSSGQPLVLVEDFGGDQARVTPLGRLEVPPGRVLQVWTKPDDATGPVSLGLLREVAATTFRDPAQPLPSPRDNQLYEITIEAEAGSPTGKPTGPVVVKGFARIPL